MRLLAQIAKSLQIWCHKCYIVVLVKNKIRIMKNVDGVWMSNQVEE